MSADVPPRPAFLDDDPLQLRFGTSGLRGLVRDMTDLEVYVNVQGFLRFLEDTGEARPGDRIAVARDLRDRCPKTGIESSPRIARAAVQAARDAGFEVVNLGQAPTPALALFSTTEHIPGIVVTGSHIPADRNGVKFYKAAGEVLKSDEAGILDAVRRARAAVYGAPDAADRFDTAGQLRQPPELPAVDERGLRRYVERYVAPFAGQRPLAGIEVVLYQHSSVARDLLEEILSALGAEVVAEGRVDHFVSVDTEDVTAEDEAAYRAMVTGHGAQALVSTDGDGDRPLVVDERGRFHRGDALGIVTARYLEAKHAVVPVSAYDAIDLAFAGSDTAVERTRIGSPWVIEAMARAVASGRSPVVGWEANGGFMTATEVRLNGHPLAPLPTRDATLPIVVALLDAKAEAAPLSALFDRLPRRFTRAGLLDDFPPEKSRALLARLRPSAPLDEAEVGAGAPPELSDIAARLEAYFPAGEGFGRVTRVNFVDGVRAWLDSGDIVHLRPSGNAPQFRIYSVADTQERADAIVERAIREPDGTLRRMERELAGDAEPA